MATLKVTIKEELVLNGKDMGNENFLSISGVNSAEHKILSVGDTDQTILLFAASGSPAAGTYIDDTLKHLRLTNLDTQYYTQLRIVDSASSNQYYVKLEPGETFILGNSKTYADATGTSHTGTISNIDAVYAKAESGQTCEIEMFIATT